MLGATVSIKIWRFFSLSAINKTSSAHVGAEQGIVPICIPIPLSSIWSSSGFMYSLYKSVLRTSPWRTPCETANGSIVVPFHFTAVSAPWLGWYVRSHNFPLTPDRNNFLYRLVWPTTSNAAFASRKATWMGIFLSSASRIHSYKIKAQYSGATFGVKSLCSLFCSSSTISLILLRNYRNSKHLPITGSTVIPL